MSSLSERILHDFKPLRESQASLSVLLVEDEWLVRMDIADALTEAGWEVVESGSGEEAIALISRRAPDILVTDIRLTGVLTGWDVADAFRAAKPGRPVVYASANPQNEARAVAGSIFLVKPSRSDALVNACHQLLARRVD